MPFDLLAHVSHLLGPQRTVVLCGLIVLLFAGSPSASAHGQLDDYDRDVSVLADGSRILRVELVKPPGYQGAAAALPLTIFLHGSTDGRSYKRARLNQTMADLLRATQGDNYERRGRCPGRCTPEERAMYEQLAAAEDLAYASFLLVPQIPETSSASGWGGNLDLLPDLIDQTVANYNIDPRRIYLAGYSDGGFATFAMMYYFPDLFAAAVPIAGGSDPFIADTIKHIPTWIFHGTNDGAVSPSYSIDMYNAMLAAGGTPRLTLVPGVGHDSFAAAFKDANDEFYPWLFSQTLVPEPAAGWLLLLALACCSMARSKPRSGAIDSSTTLYLINPTLRVRSGSCTAGSPAARRQMLICPMCIAS